MGLSRNVQSEWLARWMQLKTRGEIKRLGKEIDRDVVQRDFLQTYLRELGWDVQESDSGKLLLRRLLDRSQDARIRQNPIHINETFQCIFCHAHIPLPSQGIRDHCPHCLRGRHVDNVPGDRAAECRGQLNPTQLHLESGVVWISYSCENCEHVYRVRAHPEDCISDSLSIADLPQGPVG